jgi:hypothetical protein
MDRRTFFKALGAGAAAVASSPLHRAFAGPDVASSEYFIFIHAQGAWDVTVGLDPRNEDKGLIEAASTQYVDTGAVREWVNDTAELPSGGYSFKLVQPAGSKLVFGPGIGNMKNHFSRMTVVNGISMATVSHPDGTAYSATGRHLAGTKAVASSVDTMLADHMGAGQLFPAVSVNFPSSFIGNDLNRRAVPLQVNSIGTIAASLRRSGLYDLPDERDQVTALLAKEANDLADMAAEPQVVRGMALQYEGLRRMLKENLISAFSDTALRAKYTRFQYAQIAQAVNAAFALEMMSRDTVRTVGFSYGSFDTHTTNYRQQPLLQQRLFDMIATLIEYLDEMPHPTKTTSKLSEHTHILVVSDFCRTPQINVNGGRDHYPNNSTLIVSPKFKGNTVFGKSHPEQLLPEPAKTFSDGLRPVSPPDVLATFVSAFGADPRKYLRDGEVIPELLK